METESGFDPALWRRLGEQGITGLIVDEDWGGSGAGPMEVEAVMEEPGASLFCAALLASSIVAAEFLQRLGDDATSQRLLPAIASGAMIATGVATMFCTARMPMCSSWWRAPQRS